MSLLYGARNVESGVKRMREDQSLYGDAQTANRVGTGVLSWVKCVAGSFGIGEGKKFIKFA